MYCTRMGPRVLTMYKTVYVEYVLSALIFKLWPASTVGVGFLYTTKSQIQRKYVNRLETSVVWETTLVAPVWE